MANVPTIKGKENLFKHFEKTKGCYWKLYNAFDTKAPLMIYNTDKSIDNSLKSLKEFVEILDPEGTYILDTFTPKDAKDKDMIRPDTSVCFTLQEHFGRQAAKVTGDTENIAAGYTPEFGKHIKLIEDNARLSAESEYAATKLKDALEQVNKLRIERDVLQDELDRIEDEEEEEEEEGVSGANMGAKEKLMDAVAGLIKSDGRLILQSFLGNGFKKENVQTPINGTDEETRAVMNIYNGLKKYDPLIFEDLVLLLAIAEHQPDVFKMILENLNAMKQKKE